MLARIVTGLSAGAAYALVAVGVVLIYKCTRFLSVAQGEIGAFGFFIGLRWAARGIPGLGWHPTRFLTLCIAVVVGALLGAVIERIVIRPLVGRPPLDALIATLGIALFLALLEKELFGTATQFAPSPVGEWRVTILGATLVAPRIIALGSAAAVAFAIYLFFSRTRFGLAVRATTGDPTVAKLMGVRVNRVYRFAWVSAGALAGLGAALLGPAFGGLTPFAMTKFSLRTGGGRHRRARLDLGRDRRKSLRRRGRGGHRRSIHDVGYGRARRPHLGHRHVGHATPRVARHRGRGMTPSRVASPIVVAAVVGGSLFLGDVKLSILVGVIVTAIAALGLDVLVARTGELSLAHAAFLGVGAFTAINVGSRGAPLPVTILVAVAVTAAAATIAGLPSLRIRGLQVAITTLAFQEFADVFLFPRSDVTAAGRTWARPSFLRSDMRLYLFALALLALVLVVRYRLGVTKAGRSFLAVRDVQDRAVCFGVEPGPSKLLAYALSGAIVGLAGCLFALKANSISAKDPFLLLESLQLVAILVVGGTGSAAGIVTAAVLVKGLPPVHVDHPVHAPPRRSDRADRVGGAPRGRRRRRARGDRGSLSRRATAARPEP